MRAARLARAVLPVACLLWAGIVVGISFIEAPAKFRAPTLTLPVALDVGRHVFAASHAVQIGLGVVVLAGLLAGGARRRARALVIVAALVILAVQVALIVPVLDARAAVYIAGGTPAGTSPHGFYVGLEVLKLLALMVAGTRNAAAAPASRD